MSQSAVHTSNINDLQEQFCAGDIYRWGSCGCGWCAQHGAEAWRPCLGHRWKRVWAARHWVDDVQERFRRRCVNKRRCEMRQKPGTCCIDQTHASIFRSPACLLANVLCYSETTNRTADSSVDSASSTKATDTAMAGEEITLSRARGM